MLHWLAGQKGHEIQDANAFADDEGPQTPAPLFAVRALKHTIWGTPATAQPKPRRHSNNDTARPPRGGRPRLQRPVSTSDAQSIGSLDVAVDEDNGPSPLPSPTKGILLTPGTISGRRKTVSFGDHVVDNEAKRPIKSGLPDDCPGKFPSPWGQSFTDLDPDEIADKTKGRNKLNEAFEQVREESAKRKSKSSKPKRGNQDADLTTDLAEPKSESGKYWKQEYDIYRERTMDEVRKLVEKNQLARRYAREKDAECTDMKEELRQEQRKVDRLEKRVFELEAQLKELRSIVQDTRLGRSLPQEPPIVERQTESLTQVSNSESRHPLNGPPSRPSRRGWKHIVSQQVQERPAEPKPAGTSEMDQKVPIPTSEEQDNPPGTRHRPRHVRGKSEDDSRTQPGDGAAQTGAESSGHVGTADVNISPLHPIDVNALTERTHSIALSMGLQPPSPTRERRQDSPMRAPDLAPPSPELGKKTVRRPVSPAKQPPVLDALSHVVPGSAESHVDVVLERPNVLTGAPVPVKQVSRPSRRVDMKENDAPSMKAHEGVPDEHQQKPSAAWQAMGGPAAEPQDRDVDSNAVSSDRLAAAKARLASRGRTIS